MWGHFRRRVVLLTYLILAAVWFWAVLVKSILRGCFWWPFSTRQEMAAVILFTVLFAISCWEISNEED